MAGQKINSLLFPENFGVPYDQLIDVPPGVGNIIAHSTGAVGNILRTFLYNHVHIRLCYFGSAGSAHVGNISADNSKIYKYFLFFS